MRSAKRTLIGSEYNLCSMSNFKQAGIVKAIASQFVPKLSIMVQLKERIKQCKLILKFQGSGGMTYVFKILSTEYDLQSI